MLKYSYTLFSRFCLATGIVLSIFLIYFILRLDALQYKIAQDNLNHFKQVIVEPMAGDFSYAEDKLKFLGALIAENGKHESLDYQSTLDYNFKLLQLFATDPKIQNILLWSAVGWTGSDNIARIDSTSRILNEPLDLSKRDYIQKAFKTPWKLIFGKVKKGYISKRLIIPAGMGVTTSQGKYLGTLTIGFDIDHLKHKIDLLTKNNKVYYAIISNANHEIILKSENFPAHLLNGYMERKTNIAELESSWETSKNYITATVTGFPFSIILGIFPRSFEFKQYAENALQFFPELIAVFIIFLILVYLFYFLFLKPFVSLSVAANCIANNEVNVVIPRIKSKEASAIASALARIKTSLEREHNLVIELSEARNNLTLANSQLEQKVTERTADLEEALIAKTEFLNNMSHEMRTPIQGFTSISEGLVEHWEEFEDQQKLALAEKVANNAKRLSSLVGNLLDLSKFSAGKMLLELRSFDLNEKIESIIDECNTLYLNDKHVNIEFIKSSSSFIIADAERIAQVLRNLFINAIKFSPSNSSIIAKLVSTEITYNNGSKTEALHFSITDSGIGIPEEEIEAIFSPFTQSSKTKTKAGGTGLGLAIAKEIVEAHHGKIWARANNGPGATFEFLLPKLQSKQMDGHMIVAENEVQIRRTPISNKPATILVVDDEETCLVSMELLFRGTNYKLIKVTGGHAAINYLKENPTVDLIMLDLMMPDMYGLNVLAEVKQNPLLVNIPVILQSGTSDTTEIEKAYQMGISCYIKKPYQKWVVLAEVEKLLA